MPSKGHKSVLFFAAFVAILVLLSAYCTERNGLADEPGFLNPPYMVAHYGKLAFPTYPHNKYFDVPVITHPPMHVGYIGLLWRMGMPPYYAEATPTVLLFLLAIFIILFSSFPAPVKLGWLFAIGFLATSGETLTLCFGTRPEGELLAAWLCGLLLLESGRIANWQRWRLFAGSFFLAWTAGTHYYAGTALFGVLVYMAWAVRSLGWKQAKHLVVAMGAGGCLYGVPYLVLYVLPYYKNILEAINENQGPGGIGLSIERHVAMYRLWVLELYRPVLIRKAMALGIPFWVLTTALLACVRTTRGIALAALPLQLGLFFLSWHKMPYYLVHESVLFAGALAVAVLALGQFLIARLQPNLVRLYTPVSALVLCYCLISGSPMLAQVDLSLKPRFNEVEVAQAAGRRILGPNARVGGEWWSWHSAGAQHWYDVDHDLLNFTLLDPVTYLSNMDAFEICPEPGERSRLFDWHAEGKLKLRGFFFGQSNVHLRCLQLSPRAASPLLGYAEWKDQLYRFQEEPGGEYEVLTAMCPGSPHNDWHSPWDKSFSVAFDAAPDASGSPAWLVTVLAPRSYMSPAGHIGLGCRALARTQGTLRPDDRRALVEASRRSDQPMRFYRSPDEMPGFTGAGLPPEAIAPAGATPVSNVIDLAGIQAINGAVVDRSPTIRVTTIPAIGGFSAQIPVNNAQTVQGPCWVVLKLRVTEGRVGFGAAAEGGRLLAHTNAIAGSLEPQAVALKVEDFRTAHSIIIFNQSETRSRADLLEIGVVIAPPGTAPAH